MEPFKQIQNSQISAVLRHYFSPQRQHWLLVIKDYLMIPSRRSSSIPHLSFNPVFSRPSSLLPKTLTPLPPSPAHTGEPFSYICLYFYREGHSFLSDSHRVTDYTVASDDIIVRAPSLSPHMTRQQAELIALTRAFQVTNNTSAAAHTDFKCALRILLTHLAPWKEHVF